MNEGLCICQNCRHWQDWSDRVMAVISNSRSTMTRNHIELRRCRFIPHPSCYDGTQQLYTDRDYVCGEWELIPE